jgi:thymidylate kinase
MELGNQCSDPCRSRKEFLCTLFSALDRGGVRYCVLHSWEELPERLPSDLDIAVHPQDVPRLALALRFVKEKGYTPVQLFNYLVGGYGFFFLWIEGLVINSVTLDVIFEHRRGGLIAPSGERLVLGRRKHGLFWIPAPESEFTYLLAKKTWKAGISVRQANRLKAIVGQVGRAAAEKLSGELFLGSLRERVVEACASSRLDTMFAQLRMQTWKTSIVRHPFKLMAYVVSDATRRVRRWLEPTGLFIVFMGPDGVGKSTLIKYLVEAVSPVFRRQKVFHWRPMVLWQRYTARDTTSPHSLPPHSRYWSSVRLLAHLLDYWLGYCFLIRPLLARSGLVVFDRYFHDVLLDPKRYRFGGPLWLARFVSHLVPKPDLFFVLDAPVDIILARKREVLPEDLRCQRRAYANFATNVPMGRVIDATTSPDQMTVDVGEVVREYLARRFERRHAPWLGLGVSH